MKKKKMFQSLPRDTKNIPAIRNAGIDRTFLNWGNAHLRNPNSDTKPSINHAIKSSNQSRGKRKKPLNKVDIEAAARDVIRHTKFPS